MAKKIARREKLAPSGRPYAVREVPLKQGTAASPAPVKPAPAMLGEGRVREAGNALAGRKRQIDDAVDRMSGFADGGVVKRNGKYC